jgi:hypothetical protein
MEISVRNYFKQNLVYIFVILLFIGLSIYFAATSRILKNKFISVHNELFVKKQELKNYNERSRLTMFMDSEVLNPVNLFDSNNTLIPIIELVKTPKLVFRFTEQFCRPCVELALESMRFMGDSIGYDNILIITDVENSKLLKIFIQTNKVIASCYSYPGQFNFEIEKKSVAERTPYFMILDQNLVVSFPFFVNENVELHKIYLSRIIKFFGSRQ